MMRLSLLALTCVLEGILGLALVASLVMTPGWAGATSLVFTALPSADKVSARARYEPLAGYFSQVLGLEARYLYTASEEESLAAFEAGTSQLAWLDGWSGVRARNAVPGSRAIAVAPEDLHLTSCLIYHPVTRYPWLGAFYKGLQDRPMLFGPERSTAGRLMPEYFLRRESGVAPEAMFTEVAYSQGPLDTISRVQAGAFLAGAVACAVWDARGAAGELDASQVRLIWRTPPYPGAHWTLQGGLDERWGAGFSARLQQALVALRDADLLAALARSGFLPAEEGQFQVIREAAAMLGLGGE